MLRQPEFAHPYEVLSQQCKIVVASPLGGEAPLDPSSVEAFKNDAISSKFMKHSEALWKNTHKLSEFSGKAKEFEAIFFVGGHGRTLPLIPNMNPTQHSTREYGDGLVIEKLKTD
jgi:putative intracellular protease/amidase